ncbi:hypothetical protein PVL29_015239 [Vitis rotundifolia]|uniref:Uncharacterized protein n=1 Tax=Vitis rotundifolia TaxID=103349 RepID=A0AA38ZC07_VITRO|nr:hypothetical protein PVL29_015239 [Vitis rotundifolia]
MHSSTFTVNWCTERMALYGSASVSETFEDGKTEKVSITLSAFGVKSRWWSTKKVGSLHPPIISREVILIGCIIPRLCESNPSRTEPVKGGRQCTGLVGIKDDGEYSTRDKLSVVW